MQRDIQLVLERWGTWAISEGSQVDWSPIAAGFKGLLLNTSKSRESCCDNDGLIVDAAVGMLKRAGRDDELNLVMLHYMHNVSKEGANKQVISSQADSLIKISRIWADFFPANTSNQPI